MSDQISAEEWVKTQPLRSCPDCAVSPGKEHDPGCDVERCSACGGQVILCGCVVHDPAKEPWTGLWPGELECVERGWFARVTPGLLGWHPCHWDDVGARPDLNRLAGEEEM